MKNFIKLSYIAVIALFLFSCNKDEDDNKKSAFLLSEVEYELTNGFIESYGLLGVDEGYNYDITLTADGFEYNYDINDVTGTGNKVFFELYSLSDEGITNGTYQFDSSESGDEGTFGAGYAITVGATAQFNVASGSLTVNKSGNTYTISFECTTVEGYPLTGYYKGEAEFIQKIAK